MSNVATSRTVVSAVAGLLLVLCSCSDETAGQHADRGAAGQSIGGASTASAGGSGNGGTPGPSIAGAGSGGVGPAGSGGTVGSGGSSATAGGGGSPGGRDGGQAQGGIGGDPPAGSGGGGSGGSTNTGGGAGASSSNCDAASPTLDPALLARCTGTATVECLLGGGAGHYDVTLLLGGPSASSTVATAEARRFLLAETPVPAQGSTCVSFTVNVRIPEGQPIQAVSRGTDGLNLRLAGSAPALRGLGVAIAQNPVVLYLAGDSTVCDQDPQLELAASERYTGWGQLLPQSFRRGISVTNYADSGEGTAAFRTDGGSLWARIQSGLKRGDFVFIQLGHNDKTTPAATYRSRILGMITATKNAGATPVLVSPMVRNDGNPLAQQHIYGDLNVRQELLSLATSQNVAFIDLMASSSAWIASIGRTAARDYFVTGDSTHSNERGAKIFADFVVAGIRSANVPIQSFLR